MIVIAERLPVKMERPLFCSCGLYAIVAWSGVKSGPPVQLFACEIRTALEKSGLLIQKLAWLPNPARAGMRNKICGLIVPQVQFSSGPFFPSYQPIHAARAKRQTTARQGRARDSAVNSNESLEPLRTRERIPNLNLQ